jgi:transcriptional regulator with XRE-family HTH domain
MDYSFIGPNHIRAARGWLWWNLDEIEEKSGVSRGAVSKFETGKQNLSLKTREVLYEAFLAAGVELLPDGIRVLHDRARTAPA